MNNTCPDPFRQTVEVEEYLFYILDPHVVGNGARERARRRRGSGGGDQKIV